jgi:hypothetical protein
MENVYNPKFFGDLQEETKGIMNKHKELILSLADATPSTPGKWGDADVKNIVDSSIKYITLATIPKEDPQRIKLLKDTLNDQLQRVAETIGYTRSADGSFVPINNISKNIINRLKLENETYTNIIRSKSIEIYEPDKSEEDQIKASIEKSVKEIRSIREQLELERDKKKQKLATEKISTTELLKIKFERIKVSIGGLNMKDVVTGIRLKYKITDLVNISKTNSYKDAFGNFTNWDFCPIANERVEEIIRYIIEKRMINPNKI